MLKFVFNKVADSKACNFIKKRLQHKFFPMKFANSLRIPFFYKKPPVAASENNYSISYLRVLPIVATK